MRQRHSTKGLFCGMLDGRQHKRMEGGGRDAGAEERRARSGANEKTNKTRTHSRKRGRHREGRPAPSFRMFTQTTGSGSRSAGSGQPSRPRSCGASPAVATLVSARDTIGSPCARAHTLQNVYRHVGADAGCEAGQLLFLVQDLDVAPVPRPRRAQQISGALCLPPPPGGGGGGHAPRSSRCTGCTAP